MEEKHYYDKFEKELFLRENFNETEIEFVKNLLKFNQVCTINITDSTEFILDEIIPQFEENTSLKQLNFIMVQLDI